MDKKAEILDRAARKAIITSQAVKTASRYHSIKNLVSKADDAAKSFKTETSWLQEQGPMKLLGYVAAGVIVSQFVKRLIDAGERLGIQMMKPGYYKKMIEANPKLLEEKEEKIIKLWNSMYQTAPHLAQDPLAAGAFITQNINRGYLDELGGPPIDTYKTLADVEDKIQKNRESGADNSSGNMLSALTFGMMG